MDYIETFKTNCKNYLADQNVSFSNSPSPTQRRYEFEQALKFKIEELEKYFNGQAENWADLASKNGQLGIKPHLINEIRTLLREFKEAQMERLASVES